MGSKFLHIFVITIFLCNTLTLSAWAKPCAMMNDIIQTTSKSDMPCHNMVTEKSDTKEKTACDGICLCLHASINSTFSMHDSKSFYPPIIKKQAISSKFEAVKSLTSPPPTKPPQYIS